jgi:hypothetical protein
MPILAEVVKEILDIAFPGTPNGLRQAHTKALK